MCTNNYLSLDQVDDFIEYRDEYLQNKESTIIVIDFYEKNNKKYIIIYTSIFYDSNKMKNNYSYKSNIIISHSDKIELCELSSVDELILKNLPNKNSGYLKSTSHDPIIFEYEIMPNKKLKLVYKKRIT